MKRSRNKEKVTASPQGILEVYCYCQPAEQLKYACEAGCLCVYYLRQLQELVGGQQGDVCLCTPLDQWADSSVSDITSLHLTYLKVAVTSLLSLPLRCFFPLSSSTLSYTTPFPLASFFLSHLPDFFFPLFFAYAESHIHTQEWRLKWKERPGARGASKDTEPSTTANNPISTD